MAERELLVRIVGDDRDLQRALVGTDKRLQSIDNRTQRFGRNISRGFAAAGITLGASAVFAALGRSVDAASALNEEVAKSQQIFGSASNSIEAWSETTARSIGIARVEALKATGTFGNLFSTVGLGQREAAEMSTSLVQLAADLASFNNADPTDVLVAIRSGLIGEAEPLRRYGVLLSETRVQQEAMAASGKENVKELTNQEKALARYEIILKDTVLAQGDFARTSDGLANQSRILRAQLSDLSAELGGKLLPTMVLVVSGANDLIDAMTQAGDTLNKVVLGASLEEVDISGIEAMRDRLAEVKGEGDDVVRILDQIIERLQDVQGVVVGGPDSRGGARGFGAIEASNALVDERNRLREIKRATKEQERGQKAFDEFIQGMGLKLDRARLTEGTNDDIAVLREVERAIKRRIQQEGRTFKLVDQLTQVQLQIASEIGDAQANAQDRETDAIERRIDQQEKADEKRRDRLRRRQARRQERQFEALGLLGSGDEKVPGAGALQRRLGNLQKSVEGTVLDTKQTESQLDRIAKVLSGKFGKVGREVRQSILEMLNDISSALEGGGKQVERAGGEITRGGIRSTQRLLRGVTGLTEEQRRQIQANNLGAAARRGLSAFGFGIGGTSTTGGFRQDKATGQGIFIQNLTVVSNDPNDMMKKLQKKARRSSGGRRGRHGGANLGMQ